MSLEPDVFLGTESHLDSNHLSAELFPGNYIPHRKDRNKYGGGVFVATKDTLISNEIQDSSACEAVWNEIMMTNKPSVIVGNFYRPPSASEEALLELDNSISTMKQKYPNSVIIVGGDFILPGIDWKTNSSKTGDPYRQSSEIMLNIAEKYNMEQLISEPTRGKNTLDLCFTTHPAS